MNTIRMIAIALPVTFLLACGGGGSEGTAAVAPATPPTTTPPPTTSNPTTPPTPMVRPEPLPAYRITDITAGRNFFGGTVPQNIDETQIVREIQERATAADYLTVRDIKISGLATYTTTPTTVNCQDQSCSADLPDVSTFIFSLSDIKDLSLADDENLVGFNSDSRAVMLDRGVTTIESRAAARQDDGTKLTFQTYGGWLVNNVFGAERIVITENRTNTIRFTAFSFGKVSGSMPSGASRAVWRGVFIGMQPVDDNISQGDVTIDIDDFSNPNVDIVVENIRNMNSIAHTNAAFNYDNLRLNNDGTFTSSNEVNGRFYGTAHTEVGGTIDRGDFLGAFGATRQP